MAQSAPHYSTYDIIKWLRILCEFLFWFIFALAILEAVFSKLPVDIIKIYGGTIQQVSSILNIISIIVFFISEMVVDLVLIPMADNKRRDDFLDNSLGSKFSLNPSVGYYDNSEIPKGLYKVAVNLFENCYFTYNLVTKVTFGKIVIPAFVGITVIVFAYFGFSNQNTIAVTLLQLMFSTTVLGTLIKHLLLRAKLEEIQQDWINLFSNPAFKAKPEDHAATIYRIWLKYETLHSRIPASVPDKIYNKFNPIYTHEWQSSVKQQYNIN